MTWDMKTLKKVLKEGYEVPKGRIAITTHTIHAWQGEESRYSRTHVKVPAGVTVMVTDVVQSKWGNQYASIYYDGRTVHVDDMNKLVLVNPENKFEKKAFAITGTLTKQREFYKTLIKFKGGIWKNQVSNNTDILIVGANNRSSETTKYKKAVRLGKEIINENDLRQLLQL